MSIDLTDLVGDPDLTNTLPLQVQRRNRITSGGGKAVITAAGPPLPIYASVFPATSRQLERLKEADRTSGSIVVYTNSELIALAAGFAPDVLYWKNQPYLVADVKDYSTNGFYEAVCTLLQVVGPVPGTYPG